MSTNNVRNYTHKVSLTQVPTHEKTKHKKKDMLMSMGKAQPYTNKYKQLRNAGS